MSDACVPPCSSDQEHACKTAQSLGKHRANCAWCRAQATMRVEIAARAFGQGFEEGVATSRGARRRHAVEPSTHDHWRIGFDAGKRAYEVSVEEFKKLFRS